MKFLYSPESSLQAHLLKDILSQEGIDSDLRGEYLQGGIGELPPLGIIQLFVNKDDFNKASVVVRAWEAGDYAIHD